MDDDRDYTDEELGKKLEAPEFVPEFDENGLINIPAQKSKVLGRLAEVRTRSSYCRLCEEIVKQVHMRDQEVLHDRRNEVCSEEDLCTIQLEYDSDGGRGGWLKLDLMERDQSLTYGHCDCKLRVGDFMWIILNILPDDPKLSWPGGIPYEPSINFELVKHWTESCLKTHSRCAPLSWHSHIKDISLLRFIDVENMCLVDAPMGSQFVALSYVWGTVPIFKATLRNKEQLYSRMGLSGFMDEIPTTIQDAIQVVKEIERYLCTDAICIVQDDFEEKRLLIGSMDAVYAQATLTIAAAQGINASSGLPSARPGSRRSPRLFEYSREVKFQVAATPLTDLSVQCPWSTRGWTYQEGLLSARLLVFTSNVVHFTCNCTSWSEDLKCISESTPPPWKFTSGTQYEFRSNLGDNSFLVQESEEDNLHPLPYLWQRVVGDISLRNLSYEVDILNVAARIFGLLEAVFGVESIFGLPISRIEEFLFWSPLQLGSLKRSKGRFPSWCWCGWIGAITWSGGYPTKASISSEPVVWDNVESPQEESTLFDDGDREFPRSGNEKCHQRYRRIVYTCGSKAGFIKSEFQRTPPCQDGLQNFFLLVEVK